MGSGVFAYRDELSEASGDGLLKGRTVSVQANISVAGWPTEAGSLALKGFKAIEDATVVKRMRDQGARVAGSTRMSELGLGLQGAAAARAVAEGLVEIALVTEHVGEARLAAAGEGLIGYKPSYGLVSRYGLIGLTPSMETIGLLARSPSDIAGVMAAVAGSDERDFSMPEENVPDFLDISRQPDIRTLGWIHESVACLEADELQAFQRRLEAFAEAGCTLVEMSLPDFGLFRTAHQVIGSVEASSAAGKYDGVRFGYRTPSAKNWNEMYLKTRGEIFGPAIKPFLFQGAYYQFVKYGVFEKACRLRSHLMREMQRLLGAVDALAMPAVRRNFDPFEAATVPALYDAALFTVPASLTGLPALSLAGGPGGPACPGVQIIGPRLGDARLLALAARASKKTKES